MLAPAASHPMDFTKECSPALICYSLQTKLVYLEGFLVGFLTAWGFHLVCHLCQTYYFLFFVLDTYGKLCLRNSVGQEMSRCKTSIRRGQPNPVYKETFIFQVALFQLSDVTLMISIYNRRSMKRKEMIGWISMGQNSSGEEEQSHWQEMKESKGTQVCRWHTLLES